MTLLIVIGAEYIPIKLIMGSWFLLWRGYPELAPGLQLQSIPHCHGSAGGRCARVRSGTGGLPWAGVSPGIYTRGSWNRHRHMPMSAACFVLAPMPNAKLKRNSKRPCQMRMRDSASYTYGTSRIEMHGHLSGTSDSTPPLTAGHRKHI